MLEEATTSPSDIEILKLVHSHFDQDLREFWVRNNMYLVVTGVLVSVFATNANKGGYQLVIAAFGLVVSIFWFAVARASYLWICAWREELCRLDEQVDRFQSIARTERLPLRPLGSASGLTRWFPAVVSAGWLALIVGSLIRLMACLSAHCRLAGHVSLTTDVEREEAMAGAGDPSRETEILKMTQTHFLQDLREYWVRHNMYFLVNGVLVSVFASQAAREAWSLAIAVFGLVISTFWFLVARASYRWLGIWRRELIELANKVDPFQVYARVEQSPLKRLQSPSWLTQWLPLVIAFGWILVIFARLVALA